MKKIQIILSALLTLLCVFSAAAKESLPSAIIVSVNQEKQTINIRNQATGNRHTYFLNERTQIMSAGNPISFNDLKPGQALSLDFNRTNLGRELNFIRIPELDQLAPLGAINEEEVYYISGVVTGVRPLKRTITFHGPKLTLKRTVHVPKSVTLLHAGEPIKLSKLKAGDALEFEYRETADGLTIVSGVLTKRASN